MTGILLGTVVPLGRIFGSKTPARRYQIIDLATNEAGDTWPCALSQAFDLQMEAKSCIGFFVAQASLIHNMSREVFLVYEPQAKRQQQDARILILLCLVNVPLWALDMQLVGGFQTPSRRFGARS